MRIEGKPDTGCSEDLAGGPLCAGGIFGTRDYEAVKAFVITDKILCSRPPLSGLLRLIPAKEGISRNPSLELVLMRRSE
jgi:hypothetical protein